MTKSEIITYMKAHPGVKVTHWLFDKDEYLYGDSSGKIYTEEGYLFEDGSLAHNGMQLRTGNMWEEGWSILENKEVQDVNNSH